MGANQSAEMKAVLEGSDAAGSSTPSKVQTGTALFKFVQAGDTGKWETLSSAATPRFYDQKEDSGGKGHDWWLEVDAGDIDVRADNDLSFDISLREKRVTFCVGSDVYALRFPTRHECESFCDKLKDYVFYNIYHFDYADEAKRKKEFGDDDGMFFKTPERGTFEPMDLDEDFKDPRESLHTPGASSAGASPATPRAALRTKAAKSLLRRGLVQTDADDDNDTYASRDTGAEDDNVYKSLVIGAGANNFAMHGSHFDVLRNANGHVQDSGVSFQLRTPVMGRTPSTTLTPSRVLLSQNETFINALTPSHNTSVFHADAERGQVVSTWAFKKDGVDLPIEDIAHDNKASQLGHSSTFLGIGTNRLCRWDMRDPRGTVQEDLSFEMGKDYARGTNFTCIATSGDGFVAVGAKDGKVRLYSSQTLTVAKTAIPGLGAPITAIDVTFDGKWVLATTDKYLMVVKTTYTDDKGRASNGFTSRMGGRGTAPRLLRLRAEDAACLRHAPFSKAKFTWVTEAGHHERWVVVMCGKATVMWDFSKVRSSSVDTVSIGGLATNTDYVIHNQSEQVVDAAFQHHRYAPTDTGTPNLVLTTRHEATTLMMTGDDV